MLSLAVFLGKIFMFTIERNRKAHILTLLHSWQTDHRHLFGLNQINTNKLILRSQLVYWPFQLVIIFGLFILYSITLYYSVEAYLYHNYYLANLIFHTFAVLIWIGNSFRFIYACFFCLFMPITMINYKFDEILHTIRVSIRWNNTTKIIESIEQHQKTTRLLNDLQQLYSKIVLVVYFVYPYLLSAILKLFLAPNLNQYIKLFVILLLIFTTFMVYFFNFLCASITVRNKNAPKWIYPYFYRYKKIRIRTKMKVEAFLTRLNTEFIGIYCWNMFKFTKLSHYQYFMTVSSAYILISDIINLK